MQDSISAKMVFDQQSHEGAFRLHMWHRYRNWLMLRTILSIGLILAGIVILISQGPHPMSILMLMVGTFALLRPLVWKMLHGRNLRRLPGYGETVIYRFSPQGIKIHGEAREGELSWKDLFEIVPKKQGLLLYHAKKSYTWVPCEAFDSPEDYALVSQWADTQ
ncbi:MAG: YcxB family protein [Akkermansiaceae bacterium]